MANRYRPSMWGLALGAFVSELVVAQMMQPQLAISQGDLEARVAALEAKLAHVMIVQGELNGLQGPRLIIEGTNIHLRKGSGATEEVTLTGLGNLVVGYNEEPQDGLSPGDRDGSHNFIIGSSHNFLSFGGLVAGFQNTISGQRASVSGGWQNVASSFAASVGGGFQNMASSPFRKFVISYDRLFGQAPLARSSSRDSATTC